MKGTNTLFEIVQLSEVPTNVVPIKQESPSLTLLKKMPRRRNDSPDVASTCPDK
jgi:hypothetical protein